MPINLASFFAFAENFTNTYQLAAIPFAFLLVKASTWRRIALVSLVSVAVVWTCAKPIMSTVVFTILFGSLAVAIIYSQHTPVQGFSRVGRHSERSMVLGQATLSTGLATRLPRRGNCKTVAWACACGFIAYLPML